jgi:hypothetical protein
MDERICTTGQDQTIAGHREPFENDSLFDQRDLSVPLTSSGVRLTDFGTLVQSSCLVLDRLINLTTMNSDMLRGFNAQAYLVTANLYHGHRDIVVDDDALVFFSGENQHCRPSLVPVEPGAFRPMLQAEIFPSEAGMQIAV